jgi:hypothetical protein
MIMNRKIFTLLACALMLFSTAFYVNAQRKIAEASVGDLVKTLPESGPGMYHIQIDSICLPNGNPYTTSQVEDFEWYPVTFDGLTGNKGYFSYEKNDPQEGLFYQLSSSKHDTTLLSVTDDGRVAMISIKDLRDSIAAEGAKVNLTDLQATMWCVAILQSHDPGSGKSGEWPTFHFTNKVFSQDLDWENVGETVLKGKEKGWMYSHSYRNGRLQEKMPFYRHDEKVNGKYRVIVAELDNNNKATGFLKTENVDIDKYIDGNVKGMLKFSIVKISPIVLSAEDFNTRLGNQANGKVKLQFTPDPNPAITEGMQENYFGKELRASSSANAEAKELGYLNVQVYEGEKLKGYIANSNREKAKDAVKYDNKMSTEYLNLLLKSNVDKADVTKEGYNYSYRFVYFPSEDSLVINAYYVAHDTHDHFGSITYKDNGKYNMDKTNNNLSSYYYGLYNDSIYDHLIVRLQDLKGVGKGDISMMTIGEHPANVKITFAEISCIEDLDDATWKVSEGVYTIWDTKQRCLGVRIYNGSYSPQWIELEEGECPDRIPSYQWVVEHSKDGGLLNRINLHNREFGNLGKVGEETFVNILNILVKKDKEYQIFKNKEQLFAYSPIIQHLQETWKYEPIVNGSVWGQLIPPVKAGDCGITSKSGFRPVAIDYVKDEYLGYKHFYVDTDAKSLSYGKSEDFGSEEGMDYKAYAFKYLYYDESINAYISSQSQYNDSILTVSAEEDKSKLGFQFMLGTNLRDNGYKEEVFGYPRTAWGKKDIFSQDGTTLVCTQPKVPVLKRYYYELKVADFYNYRDDLAEEFVVLKGAKRDGSDMKNKLRYGLVDKSGENDPNKFANIYLRASYFRNNGSEKEKIYYALLDRIEEGQIENVLDDGFEVSDTLRSGDGTSKYNLFSIKVDDASAFLRAQGKTFSTVRASTFALEPYGDDSSYSLYRRLRSIDTDSAVVGSLDAPKVLRIRNYARPTYYLHEDALSDNAYKYGINFLGYSNIADNREVYAPDGSVKYNYHLFIDTAYINRGTGVIKPQYLIAVGTTVFPGLKRNIPEQTEPTFIDNNPCVGGVSEGDPKVIQEAFTMILMPYVEGRYLVNATDSARKLDGGVRDERYIFNSTWDRLAFVDAIHVDDRLYIVSELERYGIKRCDYERKVPAVDTMPEAGPYIDGQLLKEKVKQKSAELDIDLERKPGNSTRGVYYDFGTWGNYHNDVCFSFRFVQPGVKNPDEDGDDDSKEYDKRFYIESETTDRTIQGNRKIAPVKGGWIKIQNFVPVLSRGSYEDAIANADIFMMEKPNGWQEGEPTLNEAVAGKCYVVGGTNEITILNAAGKQVTVTNLLGQTLVNEVLKGNSEQINVAKGLVIVNIKGEVAVKAIVK